MARAPTENSAAASPEDRAAALLADVPEQDQEDFTWGAKLFHFLTADDTVIHRAPWTACLGNGCWDGAPGLAGSIPSVGSPDALYFAFDYSGWDFDYVSFNPIGQECGGRVIEVPAEKVGDRLFRVDPAGLAGQWRVDIFGYGGDGGDAVTSVNWTTSVEGKMPQPSATRGALGG